MCSNRVFIFLKIRKEIEYQKLDDEAESRLSTEISKIVCVSTYFEAVS